MGAMSNGYRTRIHPRDTGMWSLTQLSVHCLTCCTAAHLRRGPNVVLSSPRSAAIECFLARLGRRLHPPLDRLGKHCGGGGGAMGQVCFSASFQPRLPPRSSLLSVQCARSCSLSLLSEKSVAGVRVVSPFPAPLYRSAVTY